MPRLGLILIIAFVLRIAVVLAPLDWSAPDSIGYEAPAHGLVAGKGYCDTDGHPTAERPPGYPLFLALVYSIHDSKRAVGVAQALLGTATVFLLERLLRRRRPEIASRAALLLAVDPISLGLVPYVLREALLLFLIAALLLALDRTSGWKQGVTAGLILAALTLTHSLYVLLGPFLIIGGLVARRRVWPLMMSLAFVAAAVGAWTLRNRSIGSDQLVLTSYPVPAGELWLVSESTNEWLHDDPTTGFQELHFREIARLQREHPGDIAAVKSELYARAWANLTHEPLTVLGRVARINLWYWLEVPGSVRITLHPRLWLARIALIPFQWLRLFWAVAAILLLRKRGELGSFWAELSTCAFLAVGPALLLPIPRYLSPLTCVIDALAVLGWTLDRQRRLTVTATNVAGSVPPSQGVGGGTLNAG
ncbi:MAG TPA: hypothetical protein VFF73_28560 [Planctomycetota bacterium]|nr:hypothetical protein [Planctomycetota bacterium]